MGKGKMKKCSSCGEEIAQTAKICPKCGAKNKKAIYKRPWFIILIIVIIIAAGTAGKGDSNDETKSEEASTETKKEKKKEITYTAYEVEQLMDDLNKNALKASDTYKEQYVELTGRLSTIDSSGDYVTMLPENDEFAIIGVSCYIKNEEQLKAIKEMTTGDTIVVKGKITDVGEVLGYSLDMDSVSKK